MSRWSFHTACIDPTAPANARCKNVVVRSFVLLLERTQRQRIEELDIGIVVPQCSSCSGLCFGEVPRETPNNGGISVGLATTA